MIFSKMFVQSINCYRLAFSLMRSVKSKGRLKIEKDMINENQA